MIWRVSTRPAALIIIIIITSFLLALINQFLCNHYVI
jgi:hypothetical protein